MLVDVEPGDHNVQAPGLTRLSSGELILHCLRGHQEAAARPFVYSVPPMKGKAGRMQATYGVGVTDNGFREGPIR